MYIMYNALSAQVCAPQVILASQAVLGSYLTPFSFIKFDFGVYPPNWLQEMEDFLKMYIMYNSLSAQVCAPQVILACQAVLGSYSTPFSFIKFVIRCLSPELATRINGGFSMKRIMRTRILRTARARGSASPNNFPRNQCLLQ